MGQAVGDETADARPAARDLRPEPEQPDIRRDRGVGVVLLVVALAAVARPVVNDLLDRPGVAQWATIFVAIAVQAMPFLVLGVTISAVIAAYVSPSLIPRLLPDRAMFAVPVAAAAGAALPGCECGSVPIAGRLVSRGAAPAAALAFLLSAPAINPVVMVSTAAAFPDNPEVVLARFVASFLAAVVVGLVWSRFGRDELLDRVRRRQHQHEGPRLQVLVLRAEHDLLSAGGFLIIGAATAATLQTVVPRSVLQTVAGNEFVAVVAMGLLAVVMAICSEADAFVAARLTQFSLTSRLAFMVVGPMVDVKLVALQTGTFGRAFAVRFAPLTFVVALASAAAVGAWLL
jgi:uncharacterized membrane protein YraQ (UPF0718 family)